MLVKMWLITNREGVYESGDEMRVIAYTDGAANNARPLPERAGGWAVVMMCVDDQGQLDPRDGAYKELSGGVPSATNNQMELEAIHQALLALKGQGVSITIVSDSSYAIGALSKGWKLKENIPQVRTIQALMRLHHVTFDLVKGHAGVQYNERADVLAVEQRLIGEHAVKEMS